MPTLGLSSASLAGYALRTMLPRGRDLGFAAIEILGFEGERHSQGDLCGFAFADRPAADLGWLRELLGGYDRISVHAPFIMAPLLTANPGIAREVHRQVCACIRGMATVGGTACTVHLNPVPFRSRDEWREQAVAVLRGLGEFGRENGGVVVALETGFPADEEDYCTLIEAVDHPCVGACIDTGHIMHYYTAAMRGTETGITAHNDILNRMVARLGPKVELFHAHDNRLGDFRDHRAPGRGIIDWGRLMNTVRQHCSHAPLVLELEEPDFEAALSEGAACLRRAGAAVGEQRCL